MRVMRSAFAAAVIAVLFASSAPVSAQDSEAVSALAAPRVTHVKAADLPLTIKLGSLTAELIASSPDAVYDAGASAFVQLSLSSEARGRKGETASLKLHGTQGEILSVSGAGVTAEGEGAERALRVDGIRSKRSRTVLIEFKLNNAPGQPENRLTLFLGGAGDKEATANAEAEQSGEQAISLSWRVGDCGSRYHAALTAIGENGGNDLRDLMKSAANRDKSMSRRWMFRPDRPRRGQGSQPFGAGVTYKQARAVYDEARRMVRAGYDRTLRRKGRYGWTLHKTARDMRKYFSQAMNPAICTGAHGFIAYYDEKLSPVTERIERRARLAALAERLARHRAEAVFEATRGLSGGHPAWGGAMLVALKPSGSETAGMTALLADMLTAALYPQDMIAAVRAAGTAYEAIDVLDDRGLKAEGITKRLRQRLRDAVSAIEMAVRLRMIQARYDAFWSAFHGKLDAIRAAHADHCVCGG